MSLRARKFVQAASAPPIVWVGHNEQVADTPDIYSVRPIPPVPPVHLLCTTISATELNWYDTQVMRENALDFAQVLDGLGVVGTIDTLRVLKRADWDDPARGGRPAAFFNVIALVDTLLYLPGTRTYIQLYI
jgi:hypothetical protein